MKKKLLKILLLVLFPGAMFAQGIESSPYSAFGLGDQNYSGPAASVSMGGLNSIFWDNVHVNPGNPASYSFLSLTNFTFGVNGQATKMTTEDKSESTNNVGVSHLIMGIPMGKWGGMAFGFMPVSSTGYEFLSSGEKIDPESVIPMEGNNLGYDGSYTEYTYFKGSGSLNRFFIGGAFSPFKGFSVGVNAMYDFGNLSRTTSMVTPSVYKVLEYGKDPVLVFEGNQYNSKEKINLRLSEWNYQLGLMYTGKLSKDLHFTVGGTYGIGNSTELDVERYMYTFKYASNGIAVPVDTLESSSIDGRVNNIDLPQYGSAGLSVGNYRKWMVGVNYEFVDALQGVDNVYEGVKFTKHARYSIGGYFTPKFNSLMSYWERITYRAGFKYEQPGLNINGIDIVDYSINFGLGLPMKNGISNLNVGGAFGTRGTIEKGLVKEDYFSFYLSFSLSDKWFRKVKYN
jgi:hypothetical protein